MPAPLARWTASLGARLLSSSEEEHHAEESEDVRFCLRLNARGLFFYLTRRLGLCILEATAAAAIGPTVPLS